MATLDESREIWTEIEFDLREAIREVQIFWSKADVEVKRYLRRQKIYKPLFDIYRAEARMYHDFAKNEKEENLESFEIIANEDEKAVSRKLEQYPEFEFIKERAVWRAVARRFTDVHWRLIDRIDDVHPVIPQSIEEHLDVIRKNLMELSWLTEIFVSYSSTDEDSVNEFADAARPVFDKSHISLWKDREKIRIGEIHEDKIKYVIKRRDIALIFVSEHFLTSEYIEKNEKKGMLRDRIEQGMLIAPIMLAPLPDSMKMPKWLAKTHFVPRGSSMEKKFKTDADRSKYFAGIAKQLRNIMRDLSNLEKARRVWRNQMTA